VQENAAYNPKQQQETLWRKNRRRHEF
jgi:hypothetical protein